MQSDHPQTNRELDALRAALDKSEADRERLDAELARVYSLRWTRLGKLVRTVIRRPLLVIRLGAEVVARPGEAVTVMRKVLRRPRDARVLARRFLEGTAGRSDPTALVGWDRAHPRDDEPGERALIAGAAPRVSTSVVAVLGFHMNAAQAAKLRRTFDGFDYSNKQLFLFRGDREGELHSLSVEIGDGAIACIHPDYNYPANYLDDLVACYAATVDAIWTVDDSQTPGELGDDANPDLYRSLVPAHVLRLLYSQRNRHIAESRRASRGRAVKLYCCHSDPVEVNGALPNTLHEQNGLYWMIDYGHRIDRRCIMAYLELKGISAEGLAKPHGQFLESLTPLQYRHLLFFLNTNVGGERGVEYIAKFVDLSRVHSAIDIGSGYGGLVRALCSRGCRTTGLELLPRLMDLARINLDGHDAELIVGDFMSEPLRPCGYELVTMTDVIEHVADVERAIARTAEILDDGGFAYIKVPNYRFIDYVREDSHTGLFAITLLRHDPACVYLDAVRGMQYSVGEYYDYDYYIRTGAAYGLELVSSDNIEASLDEAPEMLAKVRDAFDCWKSEIALDVDMKSMIVEQVDRYLSEFEAGAKQADDSFMRDFMTSHWNLFFQKRAGA